MSAHESCPTVPNLILTVIPLLRILQLLIQIFDGTLSILMFTVLETHPSLSSATLSTRYST
jgi:hypothetical protein